MTIERKLPISIDITLRRHIHNLIASWSLSCPRLCFQMLLMLSNELLINIISEVSNLREDGRQTLTSFV